MCRDCRRGHDGRFARTGPAAKRACNARVIGIDRAPDALQQAKGLGAIDDAAELASGVQEADCIVLAAPVGVVVDLMQAMAPHVRPDALITDLGSVKGRIVEAGAKIFGPHFVGGHPMAGSEKSGVGAAKADLFAGAAWAIVRAVPFDLTADPFAARLAALAQALGAIPLVLDAPQHDEIAALVSHLPHLLSFAFARTVRGLASGGISAANGRRQFPGHDARVCRRSRFVARHLYRKPHRLNRCPERMGSAFTNTSRRPGKP